MSTGRAIDHVVLAVRDLDRSARLYERLGFTLTPRAFHEDRMGTSNRLIQFAGRNFIELLEVDRPNKLEPHDLDGKPSFFSFGDHNRLAVSERDGLAMLVFATDDARADLARFAAAGLQTFAPFEFERQARLPDGTTATVAFTLGFARSSDMPRVAFFVSENHAQQYFWKPEFQRHANGARVIKTVYLASSLPERDAAFIGAMFGGNVVPITNGLRVSCGLEQEVRVLTPEAIAARDWSLASACKAGPLLAGIGVVSDIQSKVIPASDACGMFIELTQA